MSDNDLIRLLQKYVDKTGENASYSYEVRVSPRGVSREYCVFLHEGASVKHSLLFVRLEDAIKWTEDKYAEIQR